MAQKATPLAQLYGIALPASSRCETGHREAQPESIQNYSADRRKGTHKGCPYETHFSTSSMDAYADGLRCVLLIKPL
jgi:hypothetical protein